MSAVMHGRRKGQARLTPELPPVGSQSAMLPGTRNLREVTILPRADWERIQRQLNKRADEEEKRRLAREEKQRLHELSKERVKNWSNTVAGQRQRKLEARRLREEKEEEERRMIDIEEGQYEAEKRKDAIERAKTQQYYQTDRVKRFHGALLLTEVLKEREAQLELKRLREQASEGNENHWLEKAQREYEEGILRDQEEARERLRKTRDNAKFQKAQIKRHQRDAAEERQDLEIEKDELRRLAAQYQLEKKRLEEIHQAEAQHLMADNLKQIDDVHRMRHIQQQQEEEEDEECRIFAAAKRKMMKLRAHKEKELRDKKQENLEKIRQKLFTQKEQQINDEDDRLRRAMEESEERRAKEEAEKEAWNRKMQGEIAEHRSKAMKERERQAAEDRKRELEMLLVRKQADAIFADNETEKSRRKFDEARELERFHMNQMNHRRALATEELEEQQEMDRNNVAIINEEEEQFQEYARKVINHCEKGGRNTYPLRQAAREGAGGGLGPVFPGKGGVRPSYMTSDQTGVQLPNYQRDTTDNIKNDINGDGVTGKRLGFVW